MTDYYSGVALKEIAGLGSATLNTAYYFILGFVLPPYKEQLPALQEILKPPLPIELLCAVYASGLVAKTLKNKNLQVDPTMIDSSWWSTQLQTPNLRDISRAVNVFKRWPWMWLRARANLLGNRRDFDRLTLFFSSQIVEYSWDEGLYVSLLKLFTASSTSEPTEG